MQIEKLDLQRRKSFGTLDWFNNNGEPSGAELIENKINELVDAVNQLVLCEQARTCYEPIHKNKIPADPYAEQRGWIGTLCRCWDSDINDDIWGILQDIKDNKTEKYYLYGIGYEHCEPVKPDDDVIYKGGDNEL